ncbi:MAG: Oxygen sensor histidine kinase NreB [Bacteroidota bacterium]|jgi:signal transduction histidine kinase
MNSQDLPQIILFVILFLVVIFTLIAIFVFKSRNKIFEKEIEKKDIEIRHQENLVQSIINTQEEERKRIAQDLHDDISSKLIALSLNLHLLKSHKTEEIEKNNILSTIETINQNAIETSRKIAHNLFPPMLEKFGLIDAIEEVVSDYNKSNQIQINFQNQTELATIGKEIQLHVFRIIQELINNSIKHGKASKINIEFKSINAKSTCDYSDNGVGIDKLKFEKAKGLGFNNIESRIKSINGNYTIDFSKAGFNFQFSF